METDYEHGPSPARIGIAGTGWWATTAHLPALQSNPGAVIAGLADPDRENRELAERHFGPTSAFASVEELLAEIELDALIVASPHATHFDVATRALEAGLHLLVEKPFVLEPAHGRKLIELARERGREIVIGYPWHYNAQALAVRSAITSGEIGKLEYVSCLFASIVRELYRGNLDAYADLFPLIAPKVSSFVDPALAGGGQGQWQLTHSAALLFWLTGLRPHSVSAVLSAFELPVDLADSVAIVFDDGAIGTLGSTGSMTAGRDEILEYRLFGELGHIVFDVNEGHAVVHDKDGDTRTLPILEPAMRYPERAPADNLVDIVHGHGENGSPPEIGLLVVEFLAAMYASARNGRAVEIPAG